MVDINIWYIGVMLVWLTVQSTNADKCLKSHIPNDELTKAMYMADPNLETGYLDLIFRATSVEASLFHSTLSYNSWLAREHDARKDMVNLWSYLTRMVVSDVSELYAHYQYSLQGGTKPEGIIDFAKVQTLFDRACSGWNNVHNTWPYNCFDMDFFCTMSSAFNKQKNIVVESYWDFNSRPAKKVENMESLRKSAGKSSLGIDIAVRTYAIEDYFNENILKFIPETAQENVFYQSKLIPKCIENLIAGKNALSSWMTNGFESVEEQVSTRCRKLNGKPVAVKYYCKAKDVIEKIKSCARLSDVTPCIFHNMIQVYFSRGRFQKYDEVNLVDKLIGVTSSVLTEFKNKVVANDRNGLNSLYNKFNSQVTVPDSMCVLDWPKAFDCTNNIDCSYARQYKQPKYDCLGGYTCRINMMYRFDCLLKFVLKQTKQLVDVSASGNWGRPEVQKAKYDLMIWLSYLPMARYTSLGTKDINDVIIDTQKTINEYVTSYNTQELKAFARNLPPFHFVPRWAKNSACQVTKMATEDTVFCNLEPLLNSVFLFINAFENSKQTTSKILNPNVNYPSLLGQLQLDRVGNDINLQTKALFNDVTNQLKENFGRLSNYFSSLAKYDKTKSDADIAYIVGQLETFKNKITEISSTVARMFQTVFAAAVGSNVLELVQRAVEVGVAIAQVAHPGNAILGGSSVLDLLATINELAQAGVTTAIIARLHHKDFPDLIERAKTLGEGFADNENQMLEARRLIEALKHGTDAVDTSEKFLKEYNGYSPNILASDISAYGTKWETVSEQMCEAAFSAGTAAAALAEIGLAGKGDCINIGVEIAELITLYEEFYDYQFDLMDALSDAARSYLAYQKSNEMKLLYSSGAHVDQAFLRHTAVNTFMVSTLNIWKIVTEYCDVLTYTRGGRVPDKCAIALQTPSHDAVAQVISYQPNDLCHDNNEITDYREIPTKPANSNDKAYVDLKVLYERETVTFKIPNFQWLQNNGWVGKQDSPKAMYIKRFELFLTPMSGSQQHTVELQVDPGMANYLRHGGTKYLLPVTGYTARYTENSFNCYNEQINNPYALCKPTDLVKLCVTSNGFVNRKVQPSIYTEWKIRATSLPTGQTAPQPKTNFKLQAAITMCVVDLSGAKKREIPILHNIFKSRSTDRSRRSSQHCCRSNEYWTGSRCTGCPSGSHQKLHGYYCQ